MGRHTDQNRYLSAIVVLDDHMQVVQRHEMDESGKLKWPPGQGRARVLSKPAFRQEYSAAPPPVPMVNRWNARSGDLNMIDPLVAPHFSYEVVYSSRPFAEDDFC
jgi:hypothetical protein